MGGGSSGPKYLDEEIVAAKATSTTGGVLSNELVQIPPEKFKGGKMRIFKKNNSNSSLKYLFLFIYLIITLLLCFYLFYLSRLKKWYKDKAILIIKKNVISIDSH